VARSCSKGTRHPGFPPSTTALMPPVVGNNGRVTSYHCFEVDDAGGLVNGRAAEDAGVAMLDDLGLLVTIFSIQTTLGLRRRTSATFWRIRGDLGVPGAPAQSTIWVSAGGCNWMASTRGV